MTIVTYPVIPYLQQDLIDNGAGVYPAKISFAVSGFSPDVNATRVDLTNIGGASSVAYVFPPAGGIQMQAQSDNAADAAAGTGIRTVILHYLDNLYAVQSYTFTMNGTSAVLSVPTNILRVQDFHAVTVGSSGQAVGNITLTNTAGTVVYARIDASFNRFRNAVFTIPAGKTGRITQWSVGAGSAAGTHYTRFTIRATAHDGTLYSGVFLDFRAISALNSALTLPLDIPFFAPPTTDIKISVISDAANAHVLANAGVSGWYE